MRVLILKNQKPGTQSDLAQNEKKSMSKPEMSIAADNLPLSRRGV
jgi:hypothetical protein